MRYPTTEQWTDRMAWEMDAAGLSLTCWVCGDRQATDTHEIERRSRAPKRWADRCNYFLTCRQCHQTVLAYRDEDSQPSHVRQLAIKRRHDPGHYDLDGWHRLGDRPRSYVTAREVDAIIEENNNIQEAGRHAALYPFFAVESQDGRSASFK
jgi:hypothetical protein